MLNSKCEWVVLDACVLLNLPRTVERKNNKGIKDFLPKSWDEIFCNTEKNLNHTDF